MPELSPDVPVGTPIWADLASSDLESSAAFYGAVLGWSRKPYDRDEYSDFLSGSNEVGGMAPKVGDAHDGWTIYLKVDDIEATVVAAAAAGGRVLHEPEDVSDIGRWALLEDPSGAEIAVWEAKTFHGFDAINEPGAPCWFELHTKDFATAVPFYEQVFGWTVTSIGDSDDFRMVVFGEPGTASAGIFDAARNALTDRSQWMLYLAVEDADAAASLVTKHGGTVFDGPADTPFGRMSHAADSTGVLFSLIQLPESE
jgi:predicted enzyme related to lactoylglutathione lyase